MYRGEFDDRTVENERKIYIMGKFVRSFLILIVASMFITLFNSAVLSQQSSEKARQILEKTFEKYGDLFKENGKGLWSVVSKLSIKSKANVAKSERTSIDLNAMVELYIMKPYNFFLNIAGGSGSVQIVIPGKKPLVATAILPVTKQFTTVTISEKAFKGIQLSDREKFWEGIILNYYGIQNTKAGKAHKINMRSRKPSEKGSSTIYILDEKWDPVRLEINDPASGSTVIELEELKLNMNIPREKFVPKVKGYTQISGSQLTINAIMQMIAPAAQKTQSK